MKDLPEHGAPYPYTIVRSLNIRGLVILWGILITIIVEKSWHKDLINRKEFLRRSGIFALGAAFSPFLLETLNVSDPAFALIDDSSPRFAVAKNANPYELTVKAVDAIGGMSGFVSPGNRVALAPNVAWNRTPEQAVNTHPEVVRAIIEMCFDCGARQVDIICNPSSPPKVAADMSGVGKVSDDTGANLYYISSEDDFEAWDIPHAIWQEKNYISKIVLDADVFINAPIAKHHYISGVTMIQKNLFGVILHRRQLHPDIHREIFALQMALPAELYILDCYRVLVSNGPQGGNLKFVEKPGQVLAGTDPIAMEAYACGLINVDPRDIGHIKISSDEGLGNLDWESVPHRIVH